MAAGRGKNFLPGPGTRTGPEDCGRAFPLLAGGILGYAVATVFTILAGRAGFFLSPYVAGVIIAVAAAAGIVYYRRLRPRGGGFPHPLSRSEGWMIFAGVGFYLLLWLVAYILPDAENDGLWYHNPTLHFWALKGRIHWITADPEPFWNDLIDYSWNGYPKGVECLGFLFLRAVPAARLLNGINLLFIPLGCLGIFSLSRFLGSDRRTAILAGLLFLLVPVVVNHASNLYIDASVASFQIALFAAAASVFRDLETGRRPLNHLPALGCALGLAAGAKGSAVILFPLLPFLLAVFWYRGVFGVPAKFPNLKSGVALILLPLLIAIAVGGYWYLRNYLHTGTPLYPIGLQLAGREIFPGVAIPSQFPPPDTPLTKEWPQVWRILYSWLDNPAEWHLAMTEVSHNSGGLGLLWLLGGLPALVWLTSIIVRRRPAGLAPGTGGAWIGILLIGAVLFFVMPPRHNHKVRYIIWLYGLGLPAFALAVGRAWRAKSSVGRRWGRLWVSAVLGIFLFQGLYSFGNNLKRISLARQGLREGEFHLSHILRAAREPYPPGYYLPELKASLFRVVFNNREPVALGELDRIPEQRQIVGHLTQGGAFGFRPIYFLDSATAADPARLAAFIRERGIRYVVWNPNIPVPPALGRLAVIWDRIPYWYYLLVVDPGAVGPEGGGGGWVP